MNDTRLYQLAEIASLGLLSAAEQRELEAWMAEAPANRVAFDELVEILQVGSRSMASVQPDTEAEWARLEAAMAAPAVAETPAQPETRIIRPPFWTGNRVWTAAAAIVLLAVVGYFAFQGGGKAPQDALHFATALGEVKEIKLADGSQVRLNGGSTLDAAAGYGETDRKLSLHGEAYFDVAKDKTRPFIVSAGGTQAQALGTAFNVRMASADGSVQLSVTEGSVRFSNEKAGEKVVNAGSVVTWDPQRGFLPEATPAKEAAGWVQKLLVFHDTPFPNAAEQIERSFGISLRFPDHLKMARVNANFDRKPLAEVLDVLTSLYGLKATQQGMVVTLSE